MTQHRSAFSEITHEPGETTEKRDMFKKTDWSVYLKKTMTPKCKVIKTVNGCYAVEIWRSLCVYKAGFGWEFWRVMPQTNPHRKRAHPSGLQHRRMRLFMRDQLKHTHVWSQRNATPPTRTRSRSACVCGKYTTQPRKNCRADYIRHTVSQQTHSHATTK